MRRNYSEAHKGLIPWNKGIPWSEEIKEKLRTAHLGKVIPEAQKIKMSNAHKGLNTWSKGRFHTEETKIKISKANSREKSSQWKGGISWETYPQLFNKQLKEKVRVRDNFICQLCGIPELECNRRLSIHHIDYNKKNCEINNLISLCHNCHCKTNYDRKYYEENLRSIIK